MQIEIDFSEVKSLDDMHQLLKNELGFPDFYGKNVNALIDCLTSLRYPEDNMIATTIEKNEVLEMKIKSLPMDSLLILNHFLIAIESVNQRYLDRGETTPIALILSKK